MLSDTTISIVFFSCIINSNTFFCRSGLSFTDLYGNYNYQKSFYTQLCDKTTPACDDYKRSKYRSANGVCNNLKNPTWGVALHEHARYLPAVYDDGIYIKFHKIDFSMLLFWAQKASTIYKSVILKFDKYVLVTFTTVLQEQQYRKLLIHNIIDYNNNNYSSIITFRVVPIPKHNFIHLLFSSFRQYLLNVPWNSDTWKAKIHTNIHCT